METLKFKTNIRCDSCIAKVSPVLDADSSIEKWEVDLSHPDKILTVSGERISGDLIKSALKKAGYIAEQF
jgi:copper chaperone CopZ